MFLLLSAAPGLPLRAPARLLTADATSDCSIAVAASAALAGTAETSHAAVSGSCPAVALLLVLIALFACCLGLPATAAPAKELPGLLPNSLPEATGSCCVDKRKLAVKLLLLSDWLCFCCWC
jgi:hypothetical protein